MAITDIPLSLLEEVGKIGLWLKTVGIIFVLWVIFQIYSLHINNQRMKEVYVIKKDMKRMEGKLDRILKKR